MDRADRRWAVLSVVVGVVAVLATVVIYFAERADDRTPEGKVAACREAHNAPVVPPDPSVEPAPGSGPPRQRWADCTLPVPAGAGLDGFWEVTAVRYSAGASSADLENADLLTSTCANLALRYRHQQQGIVATWDYTVATGQVLTMDGAVSGTPKLVPDSLSEQMEEALPDGVDGDLTVVTPASTTLASASCASTTGR